MRRFDPNARPAHQVTIRKPFYIGKYEVTQEEWETVMGENPSHFKECGARWKASHGMTRSSSSKS